MKSRTIVAILLSAIFLWLAVRKVDFDQFARVLATIDVGYLVPAVLITILVCLFRAIRWKYLFQPQKQIPVASLFSVIMIGFLANNLLPARLGDVVMSYLMGVKEKVSKSAALGTIFMDRVFDVFTLFVFLLVSLYLHSTPAWVDKIVSVAFFLLVIGLGVTWIFVNHKRRSQRILHQFLRVLPSGVEERIMQFFVLFIDGLTAIRSPALMFKAFIASVAVWAFLATGVFLLFQAFSFDLSLSQAFLVLAIVNLGLVVPSAPGSIGTFQFFCVAALGLFSISESSALGFSVVYHLSQYIPTTLVGWYCLQRENLSITVLSRQGEPT